MPSRIDIGPEGGPFVEIDEENGDLVIRVPNDQIDFANSDIVNVGDIAGIADDPHDNTQHSETFLANGEDFDGQGTSSLTNLAAVETGVLDIEGELYTEQSIVSKYSFARETLEDDISSDTWARVGRLTGAYFGSNIPEACNLVGRFICRIDPDGSQMDVRPVLFSDSAGATELTELTIGSNNDTWDTVDSGWTDIQSIPDNDVWSQGFAIEAQIAAGTGKFNDNISTALVLAWRIDA